MNGIRLKIIRISYKNIKIEAKRYKRTATGGYTSLCHYSFPRGSKEQQLCGGGGVIRK